MAIVIRRTNGDIIWFDAITQFDTIYSSSVTKHPVATGGYVSDHTTKDNVVLTISGILSDADFNISRPENLGKLSSFELDPVSVDENGLYKPEPKQYSTNKRIIYPVQIADTGSINRILPDVIAQFTKESIPEAFVTPQNRVKTSMAVKRELVSMWDKREEFQVLDLIDDFVINSFGPCVFTNITFREDESTGEALFPTMTIEQVVFTDLQEISVKIKTSNKGRKTGTVSTKPEEVPPENNPTEYTKQSTSSWKAPVK